MTYFNLEVEVKKIQSVTSFFFGGGIALTYLYIFTTYVQETSYDSTNK